MPYKRRPLCRPPSGSTNPARVRTRAGSGGRRGIRVGPRGFGQVAQLPALLVAKGAQRGRSRSTTSPRPDRPDHVRMPAVWRARRRRGNAAPRRRPRCRVELLLQPRLGRGRGSPARWLATSRAGAPAHGAPVADRVRQGESGSASGQRSDRRGRSSARVRGRSSSSRRPSAAISSVSAPASPRTKFDWLENVRARTDRITEVSDEGVAPGDQVDGGAHERHPYRLASLDQPGQLRWLQPLEARPQADVGRDRHLRLQPHQVLDRCRRGHGAPLQQQLAGQQRAVELPLAEYFLRQPRPRARAARTAARRTSCPRGRA